MALLVSRRDMSFPGGVRGGAPSDKRFYCTSNLIFAYNNNNNNNIIIIINININYNTHCRNAELQRRLVTGKSGDVRLHGGKQVGL